MIKKSGTFTDTPSATNGPIRALTGVRGLAAVWAICFHLLVQDHPGRPFVPVVSYGHLAVDLFFVLSGFVIARNYREWFQPGAIRFGRYRLFLARRLARVYPLYLLSVIATVALQGENAHVFHQQISSTTVAANFLMMQTWFWMPSMNTPSWSVSAECLAYLLFPVLSMYLLRVRPRTRIAVAVACYVGLIFVMFVSTTVHAWPLFRCIAEFSIGLIAFYQRTTFNPKPYTVGFLCLIFGYALFTPNNDALLLLLFPLLIIIISTANGCLYRVASAPLIHFLGSISYALYLFHYPIFTLSLSLERLAVRQFGTALLWSTSLALAVGLVAVSWMATSWIETPIRRWVHSQNLDSSSSLHRREFWHTI